jgi:hypothetical protein
LSPKMPAPAIQSSTATAGSSIWVVKSNIYNMRHLAHLVVALCRCITQTPPLHRQRSPKAPPKIPAPRRPIYQRHRRVINLIVVTSYIYMKS